MAFARQIGEQPGFSPYLQRTEESEVSPLVEQPLLAFFSSEELRWEHRQEAKRKGQDGHGDQSLGEGVAGGEQSQGQPGSQQQQLPLTQPPMQQAQQQAQKQQPIPQQQQEQAPQQSAATAFSSNTVSSASLPSKGYPSLNHSPFPWPIPCCAAPLVAWSAVQNQAPSCTGLIQGTAAAATACATPPSCPMHPAPSLPPTPPPSPWDSVPAVAHLCQVLVRSLENQGKAPSSNGSPTVGPTLQFLFAALESLVASLRIGQVEQHVHEAGASWSSPEDTEGAPKAELLLPRCMGMLAKLCAVYHASGVGGSVQGQEGGSGSQDGAPPEAKALLLGVISRLAEAISHVELEPMDSAENAGRSERSIPSLRDAGAIEEVASLKAALSHAESALSQAESERDLALQDQSQTQRSMQSWRRMAVEACREAEGERGRAEAEKRRAEEAERERDALKRERDALKRGGDGPRQGTLTMHSRHTFTEQGAGDSSVKVQLLGREVQRLRLQLVAYQCAEAAQQRAKGRRRDEGASTSLLGSLSEPAVCRLEAPGGHVAALEKKVEEMTVTASLYMQMAREAEAGGREARLEVAVARRKLLESERKIQELAARSGVYVQMVQEAQAGATEAKVEAAVLQRKLLEAERKVREMGVTASLYMQMLKEAEATGREARVAAQVLRQQLVEGETEMEERKGGGGKEGEGKGLIMGSKMDGEEEAGKGIMPLNHVAPGVTQQTAQQHPELLETTPPTPLGLCMGSASLSTTPSSDSTTGSQALGKGEPEPPSSPVETLEGCTEGFPGFPPLSCSSSESQEDRASLLPCSPGEGGTHLLDADILLPGNLQGPLECPLNAVLLAQVEGLPVQMVEGRGLQDGGLGRLQAPASEVTSMPFISPEEALVQAEPLVLGEDAEQLAFPSIAGPSPFPPAVHAEAAVKFLEATAGVASEDSRGVELGKAKPSDGANSTDLMLPTMEDGVDGTPAWAPSPCQLEAFALGTSPPAPQLEGEGVPMQNLMEKAWKAWEETQGTGGDNFVVAKTTDSPHHAPAATVTGMSPAAGLILEEGEGKVPQGLPAHRPSADDNGAVLVGGVPCPVGATSAAAAAASASMTDVEPALLQSEVQVPASGFDPAAVATAAVTESSKGLLLEAGDWASEVAPQGTQVAHQDASPLASLGKAQIVSPRAQTSVDTPSLSGATPVVDGAEVDVSSSSSADSWEVV